MLQAACLPSSNGHGTSLSVMRFDIASLSTSFSWCTQRKAWRKSQSSFLLNDPDVANENDIGINVVAYRRLCNDAAVAMNGDDDYDRKIKTANCSHMKIITCTNTGDRDSLYSPSHAQISTGPQRDCHVRNYLQALWVSTDNFKIS